VTGRCVSSAVHSDVGRRWHTAVLHGVGAGSVQQKGRNHMLGSLMPSVQRYGVYNQVVGHV